MLLRKYHIISTIQKVKGDNLLDFFIMSRTVQMYKPTIFLFKYRRRYSYTDRTSRLLTFVK